MKQIFLVISVFTVISLKAQPYLSVTATTKGVGLSAGYLEKRSGIELNTGYHVPVIKADLPWIFNISLGTRILISHREKDNFNVTPSIGYAVYSIKDQSAYESGKETGANMRVRETRAIYGLELGKDLHLGRIYVSARYCDKAFWGIGMRAFIK